MRRRTTVTAEAGDLDLLESEARRRGVSLSAMLREAVAEKAAALRRTRPKPHMGIVSIPRPHGLPLSELSWRDEDSPARGG